MQVLLFLKPIFDLFWQYKILNSSLIVLLVVVSPLYFYKLKNQIKFRWIDLLIVYIVLHFSWSFIRDINIESFSIYIKIMSSFYIYFVARTINNYKKYQNSLALSLLVVLIVNFFIILMGKGTIQWGDSITLKGSYYFKTDFALFVIQTIVFFRIYKNYKVKLYKYLINFYIYMISPVLIILSNARIYFFIYLITLLFIILENKERKNGKIYRFNLKQALTLLVVLFFCLFIYNYIANLKIFESLNLISFKFNNVEDFYNGENFQGRNVVWDQILTYFNYHTISERMIGLDLYSEVFHNQLGIDTHNTFLKVLYSTGYIGLGMYLLMFFVLFNGANKLFKDRELFFTCIILFFSYIISGLSFSNISYTQQSWIFMFYMGILVNNFENKQIS